MKRHFINFIFLFLCSNFIFGQFYPKHDEYKHFSIRINNDTINYHIYSKKKLDKVHNFILFIPGSGSKPLFTIKQDGNSTNIASQIPFNLDEIPEKYAFVVVSKKCIPFSVTNKEFKTPKCFFENEGLNYRVWQNDEVIKEIIYKRIKNVKKILTIGHSEGSDVVAKLATINKKITHIGFWSGGGNTQFYDFALFIRKEVSENKIDEKMAKVKMDSLFNEIKNIQADANSITKIWKGNTYRRWSQFSEPAIVNLLKIEQPLFVALGAKDESVPVESGLLIPIEFLNHKKKNLTFKLFPDYDHSFNKVPSNENEDWESHWTAVFKEFLLWVENN
ncbi:dienelactone hydrolase family protein [Flavobacterium ardleyense]|uniref:Dienelactone hydrolase family protein n=1 Tax=Flavobacterium ardleyense TaxID=2038737 RepID=A0ABW5Z8F3_9FLAO